MAVDLSGLPELPDTGALRADATQIKTVGSDVDENCIQTRNAWTPVDSAIISPDGQEQMVNALEVMLDYGDAVSLSTQVVERALSDYCDDIDALKPRYDAAVSQAQGCWAESTPEDPNYRVNQERAAQREVDAVADRLLELEQTCADTIKAANPSAPGTGGAGHPATGAVSSTAQDLLERLRVDKFSFEVLDSVTIETRVSASHLEITMADGTRYSYSEISVEQSVTTRSTRHDVTTAGLDTSRQPAPGTPNALGEVPRWARIGGNALGLLDTGLSAYGNYSEEYNQDLLENPDMTEGERAASATQSALLGAGGAAVGSAAGAALGSLIPIPVVGTVVGGVVGGIVGEWAGNTIDNLLDGGGIGESIGDAWNSLWG